MSTLQYGPRPGSMPLNKKPSTLYVHYINARRRVVVPEKKENPQMIAQTTAYTMFSLITKIAPLRVYGNGSRGTEDEEEKRMEGRFDDGATRAFVAIQRCMHVYNSHSIRDIRHVTLLDYENRLRQVANDSSLIDRPAIAAEVADLIKHQIPAVCLVDFRKNLVEQSEYSATHVNELLNHTEKLKAHVTIHTVEEFGFNAYIAAAIAAVDIIVPAWDPVIGNNEDLGIFYEMIVSELDFWKEGKIMVLLTPPNPECRAEVLTLINEHIAAQSTPHRSYSAGTMDRGDYTICRARAWLDECDAMCMHNLSLSESFNVVTALTAVSME